MAYTWRQRDGAALHLSTASGTLTLSLDGAANFSFDGAGRLLGAWLEDITYRRSLDNRVLAKWRTTAGRARRLLPTDERRPVVARAYAAAATVAADLAQARLDTGDTPPAAVAAVAAWLARLAAWDWPALEEDAARFHAIYKPISILPPDQYLALVLQLTEGCSYNRCTFCTFYRDRPFRIKSPAEFAQHCADVVAFMGEGLAVRRSIFLADANAVIIPQPRLLDLLDTLHAHFAVDGIPDVTTAPRVGAFSGLYAFISAPDALHKDAADFAALAARGLRRLYVGVETGYDPLRAFIAKPGVAADVESAVRAIKAGGVAVGLIVMVGIGGTAYREPHFQATVDLLTRLPLDAADLIYLSPFVDDGTSPYHTDLAAAAIAPLDDAALTAEEARFKQALTPWATARGVRISHYDVREFIY